MRGILTYHSLDDSGSVISVAPEQFRCHVEWLAGSHVRVVPLLELVELPDEVDAVALTFDDALDSVASVALPLLCAHALPATVFVPTAHVGADNQWMGRGDAGIPRFRVLSWDALGLLADAGCAIGAHSRRHPHLTSCSAAALDDEITGSAADVFAHLGRAPVAFAYPYGDVDRRVAACAAARFVVACTTEHRALEAGDANEALPRLDAWYFRDGERLTAWGSAAFRRRVAWRHRFRRLRRALS